MEACTHEGPGHCEHVSLLLQDWRFVVTALKFISIATPILLGIATFIVLVTRG